MKNISIALNGVLIVAIAILYYLHFSTPSPVNLANNDTTEEKEEMPIDVETVINTNAKVGYINIDSLQEKYKLYEELINQLKAKQKKYEREITAKSSVFEKKVQEFQQKAATMTQFEGQIKQKELAEEEQKLYKMRDDFAVQFQDEERKLNDQFQKKVKTFIQEHNKTADFEIIIGASELGNLVLDHKKNIDITDIVVKGLNEQYQAEKKK
ncbi:MAG: OmpH family outer membrane protein [Vicingus serpentipes]|nr:OmpH family outer membrane protein [Vicingus serpentipes]